MPDVKIKHLEFIQAIISRMNQNSFSVKGWTITIVSGLMALYVGINNKLCICIALVMVVILWILDAYYLQQERKLRGVYNDVAEITEEAERMVVKEFEIPLQKYKGGYYCYFRALASKTILPLYTFVLMSITVMGFFIH